MAGPIVVIGAGPVGQTAALLLARWGLRVIMLDGRTERDAAGSRSICQQRDVLDVWTAVGAGAIAREGLTWTTARTYYRDRELFSWSFTDRGRSPLPPFVNISQARTEEILDECVAADDLIEARWDHEVVGLSQDAGGVAVECGNGRVLRAPYVVACAGARGGVVRRALGLDFAGRTFDDQFLICDIRADLPGWQNERRFHFDPSWNPDRQVLIHPCPGSTYRIDWQVPPDFDLAAEESNGRLDRRIRQVIGDRPYEIVWRSVYRFHSRIVDRMRVGRVLLAGDCAHLVAPFGARGLNSGVPDAENAAWKLAFVTRGWAPEGLLESYHVERHAAARENLEVTGATMRFLVPRGEAEWHARRAILDAAVADAATAAEAVDSGRLAEPYWYIDSPLTTPEPTRPFSGRPPKGHAPIPAPGVIVPDAPVKVALRPDVVRLRQVVRGGLTLLVCGDGDHEARRPRGPRPVGPPGDPRAGHRAAAARHRPLRAARRGAHRPARRGLADQARRPHRRGAARVRPGCRDGGRTTRAGVGDLTPRAQREALIQASRMRASLPSSMPGAGIPAVRRTTPPSLSHAHVASTVSPIGRHFSPAADAAAPDAGQPAAGFGADGSQKGTSVHGCAPCSRRNSSGIQTSSAPEPVAAAHAARQSPMVTSGSSGTVLNTPARPPSTWSSRKTAMSLASVTCNGRPGSPGASTRPPRRIRVSHHGSMPTLSYGPTMSPGRRISEASAP